jgi:hypothetical protein
MSPSWRVVSSVAPALCKWDDEYVVHHAQSNDTYRLSPTAGRILAELMAADTGGAEGGNIMVSMAGAEAEASLSALADLGFINQC